MGSVQCIQARLLSTSRAGAGNAAAGLSARSGSRRTRNVSGVGREDVRRENHPRGLSWVGMIEWRLALRRGERSFAGGEVFEAVQAEELEEALGGAVEDGAAGFFGSA